MSHTYGKSIHNTAARFIGLQNKEELESTAELKHMACNFHDNETSSKKGSTFIR